MKPVLLLCGLFLLLSGCALDPGFLALIPANQPVQIPPRFAQHSTRYNILMRCLLSFSMRTATLSLPWALSR